MAKNILDYVNMSLSNHLKQCQATKNIAHVALKVFLGLYNHWTNFKSI
jgi:hypothetical protein